MLLPLAPADILLLVVLWFTEKGGVEWLGCLTMTGTRLCLGDCSHVGCLNRSYVVPDSLTCLARVAWILLARSRKALNRWGEAGFPRTPFFLLRIRNMQAYANLPRSRGRLKTAFYVSTTLWIQFNHIGPRVVVEDPSNEWLIHTASVVGDQCASRE